MEGNHEHKHLHSHEHIHEHAHEHRHGDEVHTHEHSHTGAITLVKGMSPVDFCLLEIKQIVCNPFRNTIDATTGCQLADRTGGHLQFASHIGTVDHEGVTGRQQMMARTQDSLLPL